MVNYGFIYNRKRSNLPAFRPGRSKGGLSQIRCKLRHSSCEGRLASLQTTATNTAKAVNHGLSVKTAKRNQILYPELRFPIFNKRHVFLTASIQLAYTLWVIPYIVPDFGFVLSRFGYIRGVGQTEICFSKNKNMSKSKNKQEMKPASTPISSFSPVVLPVADRYADLQMKVTFPASGENLPVILLSHGHGRSNFLSSYRGYGPIVEFFASSGFVVIQPTHQNSKTLALDPSLPEAPLFWSSRAKDMQSILDNLETIIATVPGLNGRVDKSKVTAIGHSLGGHTVGMLAGMEVTDPATGKKVNAAEPRLKARVLIGVPGGPAGLTDHARQQYAVLAASDFSTMNLSALVVNGDKDKNPMFSDVDNWRADAYHLSPGPKDLFTVFGAEHIFGGISGYDAAETTDEDPSRVAFVCETILAYLRSALDEKDQSWEQAKLALNNIPGSKGQIESK